MTKRILIFTVVLVVVLGWFALRPVHAYTVNFSFPFTFSANGGLDGFDPACSALVTTNCLWRFELYQQLANGLRGPQLAVVPLPATITGGVQQTISGTYKQGPPYGAVQLVAIAVAKDGAGGRVESSNSPVATVNIVPNAPGALTAQ